MCGLVLIHVGATNETSITKRQGGLEMVGSYQPPMRRVITITKACTFEQCRTEQLMLHHLQLLQIPNYKVEVSHLMQNLQNIPHGKKI
jgi:hypothetical protein